MQVVIRVKYNNREFESTHVPEAYDLFFVSQNIIADLIRG